MSRNQATRRLGANAALKIAQKALGKKVTLRDSRGESSPALREQAARHRAELRAREPQKPAHSNDAIAWPDDTPMGEYRRAWVEYNTAKKKYDELMKRAPSPTYYRFMVGVIVGIGGMQFNEVRGEGDTWEEALEKAGVKLNDTNAREPEPVR